MSDLPFGFGPPGEDPERSEGGRRDLPSGAGGSAGGGSGGAGGPFGDLFGGGADLGALFTQLGRLLTHSGEGPVNWDLAHDVARQVVAAGADRSVGSAEAAAVADALRLAEVWLDEATALPAAGSRPEAWSRAEWVEATLPAWRELCEPVAARVVEASTAMLPAELAQLAGPLHEMVRQLGGAMFGGQVGQGVGALAGEVLTASDVGVPLVAPGRTALLPANVAAFGEGLGLAAAEVRLFLALREAAHQRLFAHAPWLAAHLRAAIADYARGITVDTARLEEALGGLDPSRPEALAEAQQALAGGLLTPEDSPAQQAALARLETALALVEGWVDTVVAAAAAPHLPAVGALRESLRRRRAAGGPAEHTFATLVGLQLRPRRLREAARLWEALAAERGLAGRDAVWDHPDLLPDGADLAEPEAYLRRDERWDLSGLPDADPGRPEPGPEPDPGPGR